MTSGGGGFFEGGFAFFFFALEDFGENDFGFGGVALLQFTQGGVDVFRRDVVFSG